MLPSTQLSQYAMNNDQPGLKNEELPTLFQLNLNIRRLLVVTVNPIFFEFYKLRRFADRLIDNIRINTEKIKQVSWNL